MGSEVMTGPQSVMAAVSRPRPKASSGRRELSDVSMHTASNVARPDLVAAVFKYCDVDRDGVLSKGEMWRLALLTGLESTEQEQWALHYQFLCFELECPEGLSLPAFRNFLDDRSEDGLYCSDAELTTILGQLRRTAAPTSSSQGETALVDAMCTEAPKAQWLRASERTKSGFYRLAR